MTEIKKIMAALCLSDRSDGVMRHASQLAKALNAELVLLNVVNIRQIETLASIQSQGYEVDTEEVRRDLKADRREQIDKLLKTSGFPKEKTKTIVRVGHPVEQILKMTTTEEIDMVVVGDKGRSNIEHLLLGSVAEKIHRHSPVTVVSYRDRRSPKPKAG